MARPHRRRSGRAKAIRTALRRLGRHAAAGDVVAWLGRQGIEVTEELVRRIQMEALEGSEAIRRHRDRAKQSDKRRRRPMSRKTPPPRTYRR